MDENLLFRRDFYRQVLDDGFLQGSDPRYVPLAESGARHDPVDRLARDIEWSASNTSVQLFSGFRGSGKTTDLLRLRDRLRASGYVVLYVDLERWLNVNLAQDITTFLLASVAGVESAGRVESGDPNDPVRAPLAGTGGGGTGGAGTGTTKRWYDRVLQLLQASAETATVGISLGPLNLEADIRAGSPSIARQIRAAVNDSIGTLKEEAHGYLGRLRADIIAELPQAPGVVVLVDSLDHGDSRLAFAELMASIQELFERHLEVLTFPGFHTVFTVPPYLKFLSTGATYVRMLTTLKVRDVATGEPSAPGVDALVDLVARRGDWQHLLGSRTVLERLICLSGGHLRELLKLLAEILAADYEGPLPMPGAVVEAAIHRVRNAHLPLPDDQREWLCTVADTHQVALPSSADWVSLAALLDRHLVLGYVNGDEWYDVLPLVRPALGLDDPCPAATT